MFRANAVVRTSVSSSVVRGAARNVEVNRDIPQDMGLHLVALRALHHKHGLSVVGSLFKSAWQRRIETRTAFQQL
jgi:hypothetical protein